MQKIFKTYADENRMRIIASLRLVPLSVKELMLLLNTTQANTSKHLKILLAANIVDFVKLGQSNFYFLNNDLFDNDDFHLHSLNKISACYPNLVIEITNIDIHENEIKQRHRLIQSYIDEDTTTCNCSEVDISMIDKLDLSQVYDIREPIEYQLNHIKGVKNVPLSLILANITKYFEFDQHYYLLCQVHARSCHLSIILSDYGYNITVIKRGVDGYIKKNAQS